MQLGQPCLSLGSNYQQCIQNTVQPQLLKKSQQCMQHTPQMLKQCQHCIRYKLQPLQMNMCLEDRNHS
jgi:hypothetical protein